MERLPDIQVLPSDGQQQVEWERNRPITFEDLGIPRFNAMRTTMFGNVCWEVFYIKSPLIQILHIR